MAKALLWLSLVALLSDKLGAVRPALDEEEHLRPEQLVGLRPAREAQSVFATGPPKGSVLFFASGKSTARKDDQDAPLNSLAKPLIEARVEKLQSELQQYYNLLHSTEVILVAPTEAAMSTAIIAYGKARANDEPFGFPEVIVKASLRPFAPFQMTQDDKAIERRMQELASQVCEENFGQGRDGAMTGLVSRMMESYRSMKTTLSDPAPQGAMMAHHSIHLLKHEIVAADIDNEVEDDGAVLVVADRTFGSWLFMPGLPNKDTAGAEDESANLRTLLRPHVEMLNYAAVVWAEWVTEAQPQVSSHDDLATNMKYSGYTVPYFAAIHIDGRADIPSVVSGPTGALPGLPVLDPKATAPLPFDAAKYIRKEVNKNYILLPEQADWISFVMWKKKKRTLLPTYAKEKLRVINIVANKGINPIRSFISWSEPWGKAKGFIEITKDVTIEEQADGSIKMATRRKRWLLRALSDSDKKDFISEAKSAQIAVTGPDDVPWSSSTMPPVGQ